MPGNTRLFEKRELNCVFMRVHTSGLQCRHTVRND